MSESLLKRDVRARLDLLDPRHLVWDDGSDATGMSSEAMPKCFRGVSMRQLQHALDQFDVFDCDTGDTRKAREHLRRFLELAPDDPEASSAGEMLGYLE